MLKKMLLFLAAAMLFAFAASCSKVTNDKNADEKNPHKMEVVEKTPELKIKVDYKDYADLNLPKTPFADKDVSYKNWPENKAVLIQPGEEIVVDGVTYAFDLYYTSEDKEGTGKFELCATDANKRSGVLYGKKTLNLPSSTSMSINMPYAMCLFTETGLEYWLISDGFAVTYAFCPALRIDETIDGTLYEINEEKFTVKAKTNIFGEKFIFMNYEVSADGCNLDTSKNFKLKHLSTGGGFNAEFDESDFMVPYHFALVDFKAKTTKTDKTFTVKKGTKITFTAADLTGKVFFKTDSGKTGYITYDFNSPDKPFLDMLPEEVFSNVLGSAE